MKHKIAFLFTLFVLLLPQSPMLASPQDYKGQQGDMRPFAAAPIETDHLENFLENWTTKQMTETPLYGFGLVMVRGGEIILAKGYGADPLTGTRLNAETSVFRVASIAKLLTATAAMQLSDQGRVDLHEDVNRYLTATQLDDNFAEPVTFHHLLTHTEGFERWVIGVRPQNPQERISLQEFYTTRHAARIFPPGQVMTYDNYASGLLGLLIQEISGMPFTDYMAENIFKPLDMNSSTFEQPPPAGIRERVVAEYEYDEKKGEYLALPERISILSPAGGMHTNLMDMGHYLIAMLGDGGYQGEPILRQATARLMFAQQFTAHPQMPGMTYGLFQDFPNGHRVLRRDGDSMNAWSRVYFLPEEQTGLFFVAMGDEESRIEFANAFFDEFYPRAAPVANVSAPSDLERYRGVYHHVQDSRTTFAKTLALLTGNIRVTPADGALDVSVIDMGDSFGGFEGTTRWTQVGSDFFQREDGYGNIAFGENENGEITHLYSGQRYMGAYEKLDWYETPVFHYILMGLFAVAFLSAFLLAFRLPHQPEALVLGATGAVGFLFTVLWLPGIYLIGMTGGEPAFAFGVNTVTKIILALPLFLALVTPILLYFTRKIWSNANYSKRQRLYYSFMPVITCAFLVWTNAWNLLGFRY